MVVRQVQVDTAARKLSPEGIVYSTSPLVGTTKSNGSFVLKGPDPEVVASEAFATQVLQELNVPGVVVPPFVAAAFSGETELYFGSSYLLCIDGMVDSYLSLLRDQVAAIVVVDVWLCNRDRNIGNFLLTNNSQTGNELVAIDFEGSVALRRSPNFSCAQVPPRELWPRQAARTAAGTLPWPSAAVHAIETVPEGLIRTTAPDFRHELLETHLKTLRPYLTDLRPEVLPMEVPKVSSQFVVGGQHLVARTDAEALQALVETFLGRRLHGSKRSGSTRLASKIGAFLRHSAGIDDAYTRKQMRLGQLIRGVLSGRLATAIVPRAIVGSDQVLLFDGIAFGAASSEVRQRAERIRFLGYGLRQHRDEVRLKTGLQVSCGTVLFDLPSQPDEEQEYVVRQVREFTTVLSDPGGASFLNLARQTAGMLPAE